MNKKIAVLIICMGMLASVTGCQTDAGTTVFEQETVSESNPVQINEIEDKSIVSQNEIDSYAYAQLSKDEQSLYQEIYQVLYGMNEDIMIHTLDADRADRVFQFVMTDHPELFFVDGYVISKYTTNDVVTHLTFTGKYNVSIEERESKQQKVDDYVKRFLQNAPTTGTDYEKMKYVYEYIINHTEYSLLAEDNQNICSVFINGSSVCQGYAKATQYLLGELNVFSTLVSGTISTGGIHAWNLVKLDDTYCYVDTTWGDASYQTQVSKEMTTGIDYDYLGADDEMLSKTHTKDAYLKLPVCDSLEYYYYVKENQYFTSYEEEAIKILFERGYQAGWESVTLKCADDTVYEEMLQKLIEKERIFQFMKETKEIRYVTMKEKQMLIIYL